MNESTLGQFNSQSALVTAGDGAEAIWTLTLAMSVAAALIFVFVMAMVWLAWRHDRGGPTWSIWAAGIAFPALALVALVVGSTLTLAAIGKVDREALVIEVTGHQYWWDVVYDPEGRALRDANELFLPRDRPVTLRLKTDDVIHSFWVPSLSGKMDMIPGVTNEITVTARQQGRFRGQCAEFCGLSHPLMAFETVVVEPPAFDAFLEELEGEADDVATSLRVRGREVFLEEGCAACHAIRGVAEGARLGPDLTRLGARASLGAGMWEMNRGNLGGWIADVQDMKPGAEMPSYNHLSGPDLRALVAYLDSLK